MTEQEILDLSLLDITSMWEKDSKIDYTEVGQESAKTGAIHSRYLKILYLHNSKLREAKQATATIRHLRQTYYDASIDQETEKKYGWVPFTYKVLRNDMERFLSADELVQKAESRIAYHEDIVEFCRAVVKEIGNRSYQLKAAVDWQRLMAGFNT